MLIGEKEMNQITKTNFRMDFFKRVKPIKLTDPLAAVLGAVEPGEVFYYHYTDLVKMSGHSCPAVSGAFKMTEAALSELYENEIPVRGNIRVTIKGAEDHGANGPISQVISLISGAANDMGFKGLQGRFNRYKLLAFDAEHPPAKELTAEAEFERVDTGRKVTIQYNSSLIPGNPEMMQLMPLVISGQASEDQLHKFGDLWQGRVERVLLNPPRGVFTIVT